MIRLLLDQTETVATNDSVYKYILGVFPKPIYLAVIIFEVINISFFSPENTIMMLYDLS